MARLVVGGTGTDPGLAAESLTIVGASNQYATLAGMPSDFMSGGFAVEFSSLTINGGNQTALSRNSAVGGNIWRTGNYIAFGTGSGWRRARYAPGDKVHCSYDPALSGFARYRIWINEVEGGSEGYLENFVAAAIAASSEDIYLGRRQDGTQQMDGSLGIIRLWPHPQEPAGVGSSLIELGDINGDSWRDLAGFRDAILHNFSLFLVAGYVASGYFV